MRKEQDARTRGPEKGGSGKTWQHMLQHDTGREHYVLALVATPPPVVPKQPPAKQQQPQSASSSKASSSKASSSKASSSKASSSKASSSNDEDDPSYGLTCLHHAIAERVMQRSVFNCLTPGAKATSIGYQFHFDKGDIQAGAARLPRLDAGHALAALLGRAEYLAGGHGGESRGSEVGGH